MSNVYARNRKTTDLAFLMIGQDLQTKLTIYVMNEKRIPKKWRYMVGRNIIAKVDELVDNIVAANSIYPTTAEELEKRKLFQSLAICNCYQLQNKIIRLINCINTVTVDSLTQIIKLLHQEIATLKKWKKASKLMDKSSVVC